MLKGKTDSVRTAIPAALGVAVAWLSGTGQPRATTTNVPVTPAAATTTTVRTNDDDNKGGG